MAPGIGGNGGGPRQTGTVPKTKSHNEASREYNGATHRDYHPFNPVHMPNNLSSLDWQPVNETLSHPRTRKESNTSASRFSESFDAEDNGVTQDNLWFNTGQRNSVYNSDDDEVSQASWAENGYKSNNLGLPDKAQVASRLHQIRDYVSQTVTMMEGLRATGGQRNMAQHEKLSSMLEGLRDSELKLQSLYERLQRMPAQSKGETENFASQQMLEASRERANKPVASSSKATEAARKNELKKQVQISQLKLQELQEQQATLKALKLKAQEQLNEARAAQGALMAAHGSTQAAANTDNMIQERLHNLQRFFDTRQQIVQIAGLEDEEVDQSEVQDKLDELQAKKQHMDQLLAQFSNLHTNVANNVADEISPEECERDVQNKMAELNAMREFLSTLQNSATQLGPPSPQERVVKKDSRGGSVEKSNAPTSQALHLKTQQLNEAKARLQQLQNLLHTVEDLRSSGQPIPESVLRLMNGSEHSSSPTQQDRSDMSSQELNVSQGPSERERLVNSCERAEVFERSCRSLNSCERERAKPQPAANTVKHNNQEGKVGIKIQLEELIRNQELNLPQPLQSTSFQENGTTIGTWGGSTQSTMDEGYNPDYSGDLTETTSVKNASSSRQPHNMWRKPSTGSASRYSWSSPYVPREVRRGGERRDEAPASDIPPQPDSHWVVHQISQLQSQLQQMSGLYKNFVEKQQNCPPWLTPPISAALGPYCQYIASAGQWQQQQLLVQSLNQCCQLIWHQQRELAALKETLAQLHHQTPETTQFSPPQQADVSSPPSNLGRAHTYNHVSLKPSTSSGPTLAPPAVVSSAHSLPNLASPQSPPTPPPINNRNLLASPTATVLSLPPSLNTNPNPNIYFNPQSQFTDPNFINLYPPYGNNLNFEFPSPVNFFPNPPEQFLPFHPQPQPATTLNNQVPPGNRANNYWDNFRSYSRQNLLSNSGKSNDGVQQQYQQQSQRTPMERFLNTDQEGLPPPPRSRKERLVGGEVNQLVTRAQVHHEEGEGEASGYQFNLALPLHGRQPTFPPHNNTYSETEGLQGARLVNDCEAPRGANKHKRNYVPPDIPAREAKVSQLNNYHTEPCESNTESESSRAINLPRRHPRNINSICDNSNNNLHHQQQQQQQNCIGDGYCLMASDKGVRRKDNRGNVSKDCKTDVNGSGSGDTLEECVYSEVAALISVNEWRPQYLLQLFKDLRLLSSSPDPGMQATLSSTIHALASRNSQEDHRLGAVAVNEESSSGQALSSTDYLSSFSHQPQPQPRNWTKKEAVPPAPPPPPPQLPSNCAKLDREVRSVLTEMLPFLISQAGETCGPALLDSLRRLTLHLVHTDTHTHAHTHAQDQLDAQLEDALHKFTGCRLGDVYEELLIVVADVLISELTFLRLVNTVHHNHTTEQPNGDVQEVEEEEEDEGAVGGVGEGISSPLLNKHPVNQTRRNKSEPVSEADLAEADQSRHTTSGGEEERGDTAEGIDQPLQEEASGRDLSMAACNGISATESKTEACWAVEQDRELGLDQVPTRLHNNCETEPEASHSSAGSVAGPSDSNTSI